MLRVEIKALDIGVGGRPSWSPFSKDSRWFLPLIPNILGKPFLYVETHVL